MPLHENSGRLLIGLNNAQAFMQQMYGHAAGQCVGMEASRCLGMHADNVWACEYASVWACRLEMHAGNV